MLDNLSQFHFLRPWWFLLLIPLAVCLWMLVNRKLAARGWEKICDTQLLPYVLIHGTGGMQQRFYCLFGIAGFITTLALAGPAWERLPQPVFRSDSALVIVLDMSRSMNAADVTPSRLERARFKVIDILDQRLEGETALIVYAGDAFTVTPLTADVATIKAQLPALSTGIMPIQGHRADLALKLAAQLMRQAGHPRGGIILITDEIDPGRDTGVAAQIHNQGYRISVLGVGTDQGAPIALPNGGFLKDNDGEIVIPMLDHAALMSLAGSGGGQYRALSPTASDVIALMNVTDSENPKKSGSETTFTSDLWQEQGPWLVLLLLPLVAFSFRRGVLFLIVLTIVPLPQPAQALDWESLWLTADQRAQKLLEEGNSEAAAQLFTDQQWKAAAQYRSGNYARTLETLEPHRDITSLYNKGNALARSGKFAEAIAMYEDVLEQQPDH
ncbi:MAG: VWA domain-containing protein, partial [Thiotrichales bacterium]|nr:VWA domain-containing protein [Thiotrichales bacterium]